ncbi:amino acid racemase [Duganella sp. FT92W]|uniref:Amino acid racemase n=1 Tax=Pseudoduganella rivuli TaxID=2666085 RepID=A0A7X2LVQ5_9BURK|nr:amino acid racemase [Pseudoduganella rivuli]MRV75258.1 amino acid racemase [Pseudoduganella rivuli]
MPSTIAPQRPVRHLAIIGGLGTLASQDLYSKLAGAIEARGETTDGLGRYRLSLDRQPCGTRAGGDALLPRKLYLYDRIHRFEATRADGVLLPCFISHTFLDQLQAELGVRVFDMMAALAAHVGDAPLRIGVLCSTYVREQRLFERYFPHAELVYPQPAIQRDCVMRALYGADGNVLAQADHQVCAHLRQACADLERQGAQLIIPGASEFAALARPLQVAGHAVVDSHHIYAMHVLAQDAALHQAPFKLGIVGGIGPAATVDFMHKIVRNTDAARDQEHVRLIVEHNPQIPDRTANLVGNGDDPTLALYSACKRLEENGAALIAMPCNTAHAYIARIQDNLAVPIVNMLEETIRHIGRHHAGHATVGLLATTGTVSSGVYHAAAQGSGFSLIVPDARHQQDVMEAIYGEHGVKAGHTEGPGKAALLRAAAHLAERGATVIILGCTELPLLLPQHRAFAIAGKSVALLDPTDILARRCVALAQANRQKVG